MKTVVGRSVAKGLMPRDVRFIYDGRNGQAKHKGVITVAYTARVDEDDHTVAVAGLSFCSPKDQFVKKIGRIKAIGRMKSTKLVVETAVRSEETIFSAVIDAVNMVLSGKHETCLERYRVPGWAIGRKFVFGLPVKS